MIMWHNKFKNTTFCTDLLHSLLSMLGLHYLTNKKTDSQLRYILSIKLYSVRHESWQSWDGLSQSGARLCRPKACIGNDWRGINMPACRFLLLDLQFGPQQVVKSNNLFMLDTDSFIDAHGRLMTVLRWTKLVSQVVPSSASHSTCKVF